MDANHRLSWMHVTLLLCAMSVLSASSVYAADQKSDREQVQLRRLQQVQRKLEQEKTQLGEEKAQLSEEKALLDTELTKTKELLHQSSRNAEELAARSAVLDRELSVIRLEKVALTERLAETMEALKKSVTTARQLDEGLKQNSALLSSCETRNEKLHSYGVELLDRYEKKSCSDAMLKADPFTQLKRVEIENLKEDYRDKLDEQKLGDSKSGSDSSSDNR